MKTENEIIDILYKQYQSQGYIAEQAIFDLCDNNSLSFLATDRVCDRLINLGVLISDINQSIIKPNDVNIEDNYKDYSQIDYNTVFDFYIQNYPQMYPIISYIKGLPPPQKGENNNLVIQMRSGNKYARQQAIEKNLRTVLRIAMKYNNKTCIPIDELFSVACEGLIAAVDSFDPYSNSYFTSYSSLWIMQKIDRYIMDNQYLVRIPVHSYEMLNKVKEIVVRNDSIINSRLINTISSELDISYPVAEEWIRIVLMLEPIDIDEIIDDEHYTYNDTDLYIESISDRYRKEQLNIIVNKLTQRETQVITMRYGLDGKGGYTLEEVGNQFKVTRERIRQIEATSIRKIKHHIKNSPLYSEYSIYYEKEDY